MRALLVKLHRYLGLFMAGFLLVAGLTGSILAFDDEIDAWLNPQLFGPQTRGEPLSPQQLVQRVQQQDSRVRVSYVQVAEAGRAARVSVRALDDPNTGRPYVLGFNQLFADPVSGNVLGTRQTGAIKFDRVHFIPLMIQLHYSLLLPGSWGLWLFGVVALLWTVDCVVALCLTLPRGRPFMEKWKPAWMIKQKRFNYDLHRAGGLWPWLMLLVLAISSVSLNLYDEVFKPVVNAFSPIGPTPFDERAVDRQRPAPAFDYDAAVAQALRVAQAQDIDKPLAGIGHRSERGFYFSIHRNSDGTTESGLSTRLYFDDQTGLLIGTRGTGSDTAGEKFAQWQYPLHSGRIAGFWGRAFIALMGIMVSVLSVTGLVIWWRKRRARAFQRARPTVMVSVKGDMSSVGSA